MWFYYELMIWFVAASIPNCDPTSGRICNTEVIPGKSMCNKWLP